jgi:hypothetical protein
MNSSSKTVLESFEQLPEAEKQLVAMEILRRAIDTDHLPLQDEELLLNAEAIFLSLDEEEAEYEQ